MPRANCEELQMSIVSANFRRKSTAGATKVYAARLTIAQEEACEPNDSGQSRVESFRLACFQSMALQLQNRHAHGRRVDLAKVQSLSALLSKRKPIQCLSSSLQNEIARSIELNCSVTWPVKLPHRNFRSTGGGRRLGRKLIHGYRSWKRDWDSISQ